MHVIFGEFLRKPGRIPHNLAEIAGDAAAHQAKKPLPGCPDCEWTTRRALPKVWNHRCNYFVFSVQET
jgi:hypothetical protein